MKKSVKKFLLIALGALGVAANQAAQADQTNCTTAPCDTSASPLAVNFSIVIPAVLRFQVGDTAATSPSVQWTAGNVTAANMGTGAVNADTVTNGGPSGGTLVDYALVSNLDTNPATITAAGVGTLNDGGANTIPYTDIDATANDTSGNGAVALPVPGTPTVISPTSGVIDRTGTWQYTFANTTIYPAGTYTGTINYTVAQP